MIKFLFFSIIGCFLFAQYSWAQNSINDTKTGLPVPRFVSLRFDKGFARRGPSRDHKVDWVYSHHSMPLKVIDEYNQWRKVEDMDGLGGWMHLSILSGRRSVLFKEEGTLIYRSKNISSHIRAKAQKGAIAYLDKCDIMWCYIKRDKIKGWVKREHIWGVLNDEYLH